MNNLTFSSIAFWSVIFLTTQLYAQSPLTVRQVFDFNVGDEFHYSTSAYGNYTSYGGFRLYVLNKTISPNNDSVKYQFHMNKFGQNINQQNGQLIDTFYQTRVFESTYYNLDSSISLLMYYNDSFFYLNYYSLYSSYLSRLNELNNSISQGFIDSSCVNQISFSDTLDQWQLGANLYNAYFSSYYENTNASCNLYSNISRYQRFAEGLGTVSSTENVSGGPYYGNSYGMVYYRKGSNVVGTPFSNLVATEEISKNKISVFPNPTDDYLNISSSEAYYGKEFIIYNASGIAVHREIISAEQQAVSLIELASGIYFIKIDNSNFGIGKIFKE